MQKTVEPVVNVNDISRISRGVIIKGDMSSATDIRIDGHIEGTIYSRGKIVVGETAVLSGTLICANADLWGKMDGDIYAKDVLSLKSSAIVNGNIHMRRFQVEMGAQINGNCKTTTEEDFDKLLPTIVKNVIPDSEAGGL